MVKISIEIQKDALKKIDNASKKEFRSRTSFLVNAAVKKADKILKSE